MSTRCVVNPTLLRAAGYAVSALNFWLAPYHLNGINARHALTCEASGPIFRRGCIAAALKPNLVDRSILLRIE